MSEMEKFTKVIRSQSEKAEYGVCGDLDEMFRTDPAIPRGYNSHPRVFINRLNVILKTGMKVQLETGEKAIILEDIKPGEAGNLEIISD